MTATHPDFFASAHEVLNARARELAEKYPAGGASLASYPSRELFARDMLGLVRLGAVNGDADLARDARDIRLLELVRLAYGNESGAALELHGFLSDSLSIGAATPAICELLAAMHNALSRGLPADEAMRTKLPRGRPKNARRDEDIRGFVLSRLSLVKMFRQPSTHSGVYKEAARIFCVSVKTVRNIVAAA